MPNPFFDQFKPDKTGSPAPQDGKLLPDSDQPQGKTGIDLTAGDVTEKLLNHPQVMACVQAHKEALLYTWEVGYADTRVKTLEKQRTAALEQLGALAGSQKYEAVKAEYEEQIDKINKEGWDWPFLAPKPLRAGPWQKWGLPTKDGEPYVIGVDQVGVPWDLNPDSEKAAKLALTKALGAADTLGANLAFVIEGGHSPDQFLNEAVADAMRRWAQVAQRVQYIKSAWTQQAAWDYLYNVYLIQMGYHSSAQRAKLKEWTAALAPDEESGAAAFVNVATAPEPKPDGYNIVWKAKKAAAQVKTTRDEKVAKASKCLGQFQGGVQQWILAMGDAKAKAAWSSGKGANAIKSAEVVTQNLDELADLAAVLYGKECGDKLLVAYEDGQITAEDFNKLIQQCAESPSLDSIYGEYLSAKADWEAAKLKLQATQDAHAAAKKKGVPPQVLSDLSKAVAAAEAQAAQAEISYNKAKTSLESLTKKRAEVRARTVARRMGEGGIYDRVADAKKSAQEAEKIFGKKVLIGAGDRGKQIWATVTGDEKDEKNIEDGKAKAEVAEGTANKAGAAIISFGHALNRIAQDNPDVDTPTGQIDQTSTNACEALKAKGLPCPDPLGDEGSKFPWWLLAIATATLGG